MALFNYIQHDIQIAPPLQSNAITSVTYSPYKLLMAGFNLQVLISSIIPTKSKRVPKTATMIGHFDTGASTTSIDFKLAELLELIPDGLTTINTANGVTKTPHYHVYISFPNTNLGPFDGIQVCSCNLGFDPNQNSNAYNVGLVIGRDIMSRWNIVWNGPTSCVFIAD